MDETRFARQIDLLKKLSREKAPENLERRVFEEIRNPETRLRRFLSRLERKTAPPSLWQRVQSEIRSGERQTTFPPPWISRVGAAAAAVLLVVGGYWILAGEARPPKRLTVQVVDVENPDQLSAQNRFFLDAATGGIPGEERK